MTSHTTAPDFTPFLHAALTGIAALETHDPTTRRFGPEADSAWSRWSGHLDAADRIGLVLRDAAVSNPAAFAPRVVFALHDLADDEPFGPTWQSPLGSDTGRRAWSDTQARIGQQPPALWQHALDAWDVKPGPEHTASIDRSTRIVVIGTGAVTALALRFLADRDLDWSDQVTAICDSPAGRQLAGLVPVIAGVGKHARVLDLGTDEDPSDLESVLAAADLRNADVVVRPATSSEREATLLASIDAS